MEANNPERLWAVYALEDHRYLAKVALEADDPQVRSGAAWKLTEAGADQALLANVALQAEDSVVGLKVLRNVTDSALRAKIAMEALNSDVALAALDQMEYVEEELDVVKKMTHQARLAEIAVRNYSHEVRLAAVKNLSEQALLAKVAIQAGDSGVGLPDPSMFYDSAGLPGKIPVQTRDSDVRMGALWKITAPALLAKLAVEAGDSSVRLGAVSMLTDRALLAKVAAEARDSDIAVIAEDGRTIGAFDSIPQAHRIRLMRAIIPAIRVLTDPDIVTAVGKIISIRTTWLKTSATYDFGLQTLWGEQFGCSIQLEKLSTPLHRYWTTNFPVTVSLPLNGTAQLFFPAKVNAADLLGPVVDRLPQGVLERLAVQDHDREMRQLAVVKLTDQAVLAKLAVEDADEEIRQTARERLDALREAGEFQ